MIIVIFIRILFKVRFGLGLIDHQKVCVALSLGHPFTLWAPFAGLQTPPPLPQVPNQPDNMRILLNKAQNPLQASAPANAKGTPPANAAENRRKPQRRAWETQENRKMGQNVGTRGLKMGFSGQRHWRLG